jgi:addiction module toxin, RelE/StbE family
MRTIEHASIFKRDYKRTKATPKHSKDIESLLTVVVPLLATDQVLPEKYCDHALSGDWSGYRECHIKSDLLLVYRKSGQDMLRLARLGSHSELFG